MCWQGGLATSLRHNCAGNLYESDWPHRVHEHSGWGACIMSEQVDSGRDAEPVGPRWFQAMGSGWTTVILMGIVATASQLAAISLAGLELMPGGRVWSTGGVAAVVSGLLMWKLAKPWQLFKRWVWVPLLLVAVASFVVVGASNNYDVEIVDQEYRPATQSMQPTGAFNIAATTSQICEPGEDYLYCLNAHVGNFNAVCPGQRLSSSADSMCASLSDFIAGLRDRYEGCGYGCTTAGEVGNWGWPYLRLEPEFALKSNNDAQPRLTHTERCYFDLGVIQIGTCMTTALR